MAPAGGVPLPWLRRSRYHPDPFLSLTPGGGGDAGAQAWQNPGGRGSERHPLAVGFSLYLAIMKSATSLLPTLKTVYGDTREDRMALLQILLCTSVPVYGDTAWSGYYYQIRDTIHVLSQSLCFGKTLKGGVRKQGDGGGGGIPSLVDASLSINFQQCSMVLLEKEPRRQQTAKNITLNIFPEASYYKYNKTAFTKTRKHRWYASTLASSMWSKRGRICMVACTGVR